MMPKKDKGLIALMAKFPPQLSFLVFAIQLTLCSLHCSEVFKARHRKSGALVALKKVLMDNEKEGVSQLPTFKHAVMSTFVLSYHLFILSSPYSTHQTIHQSIHLTKHHTTPHHSTPQHTTHFTYMNAIPYAYIS